jgi:beta-phosphoglucomutase family hydrolase
VSNWFSSKISARQGVLWDMDGVLVDTGEFHIRSWQDVLDDYGIAFDRLKFQQALGMNNAGTIELLMGHKPDAGLIEAIATRKEECFRQLMIGHVTPLPGVLEWLQHWHDQQIPMAVASSASAENINFIIDALHIRSYFHSLVSGADIPGKPDPAVFLSAAQHLGLPPTNCIVIEDSIAGVEAARRAGMRCIAVTTTNPAHALTAADLVVSSLAELKQENLLTLLSQ